MERSPRVPSGRFSPAAAAALGLAAGFYAAEPSLGEASVAVAALAAAAAAGLGAALRSLGSLGPRGCASGRARRIRSVRCYALSFGLVGGAAVAGDFPAEAAGLLASPAAGSLGPGLRPEVSPRAAAGPPSGPVRPQVLRATAASGRLVSDSCPVKGGFRSYPLALEGLRLEGGSVYADLDFPRGAGPRPLRVLAAGGPPLDAGGRISARGSPSGDGAAFFSRPRDMSLEDPESPIDRARSSARLAFRLALARVGRSSAGLLEALILGSKEGLSAEEAEAFAAAGCAHVLALSGEHLSVLAALALMALKPLMGPYRARIAAAALAAAFMWIAGAGPSLLRAVLMAGIGAVAALGDRPLPWTDALSLAFLLALPADPEAARSLGFVLSYLAVLGLALLGPRVSFCLEPFLPPALAEPAAASIAAQAAVSPVLAFSFGCLQFAGIPASIAAGPLVVALMWWGMGAGLACAVFPALAPAAAWFSDAGRDALFFVMDSAAAVPPLTLPGPPARGAACLGVAAFSAFVYARPYAEYRSGLRRPAPRLRLAVGAQAPAGVRGPGDVQALRPEFPREPLGAGADPGESSGEPGR